MRYLMLLLSWSLTGVFAVVTLLLLLKLYLLRKSAGEIADAFAEHLREDTNNVSCLVIQNHK